MKIITFYSDTHQEIFNFFKNSFDAQLSQSHELKVLKIDQISKTGECNSAGFNKTMIKKLEWIIDNIDCNSNELMMYVDCDAQFFKNIEYIEDNYDIKFQHDYDEFFDYRWYGPPRENNIGIYPNYCAGMFICKQNHNVLKFFKHVKEELESDTIGVHDQTMMNKILNDGYSELKHGLLDSKKYWTVGFETKGNPWNGEDFQIPDQLIAHHANFTYGIENKLKLLNKVKDKYERKN